MQHLLVQPTNISSFPSRAIRHVSNFVGIDCWPCLRGENANGKNKCELQNIFLQHEIATTTRRGIKVNKGWWGGKKAKGLMQVLCVDWWQKLFLLLWYHFNLTARCTWNRQPLFKFETHHVNAHFLPSRKREKERWLGTSLELVAMRPSCLHQRSVLMQKFLAERQGVAYMCAACAKGAYRTSEICHWRRNEGGKGKY
jgi:hypothetical protein